MKIKEDILDKDIQLYEDLIDLMILHQKNMTHIEFAYKTIVHMIEISLNCSTQIEKMDQVKREIIQPAIESAQKIYMIKNELEKEENKCQ